MDHGSQHPLQLKRAQAGEGAPKHHLRQDVAELVEEARGGASIQPFVEGLEGLRGERAFPSGVARALRTSAFVSNKINRHTTWGSLGTGTAPRPSPNQPAGMALAAFSSRARWPAQCALLRPLTPTASCSSGNEGQEHNESAALFSVQFRSVTHAWTLASELCGCDEGECVKTAFK